MAQCHKRAFVNHPRQGESSVRTAPGLTKIQSDRERSFPSQAMAGSEGLSPAIDTAWLSSSGNTFRWSGRRE